MKWRVLVASILILTMLLGCSPKESVTPPPTQEAPPSATPETPAPATSPTPQETPAPSTTPVPEETPSPPTPTPAPTTTSTEDTTYQGPMIDAHSHFWPDLVLTAIRESGLEEAIIFFTIDSPLWQTPRMNLPSVVPFVQFDTDSATQKVVISKEAVQEIQRLLETEKAKGIGELLLRSRQTGNENPCDQPLLLEVYDLAAKHGVPAVVHVEHQYAEELERALAYNREAKIIWAHYGDASPELLRDMMARNSNLYADLSAINPIAGFRNPEIAPADAEGNIKADWKALFLEFPDRFVFGIDMGITEERYQNAPEVVKYYRKVLGQLPNDVAKKIANDNILALLGR